MAGGNMHGVATTVACAAFLIAIMGGDVAAQPLKSTVSVGGKNYTTYDSYYGQAVTVAQIASQSSCTTGAPVINVTELTIAQAQAAFSNGTLTCSQLVQAYFQRITAYDRGVLDSILAINPAAVAEAQQKDAQLKAAISNGTSLPPLFCVPLLIKDLYDLQGMPTTAGAVAFEDNYPTNDGTPVAKLRAQGAIVIAKASLSEWAQSATNSIGSIVGIVKNPYGLTHTTGGSSGGSAAATAANLGLISLGTDTGSSIRTPSAFQNLVGIRPSIGLASRKGVVPLNYYKDSVGPLGRTVTDVAKIFEHLVGPDPLDPVTELIEMNNITIPDNYTQFLVPDALQGMRIGVLDYLATRVGASQEIIDIFNQAVDDMVTAGAEVVRNITVVGNSLGDVEWDPNPLPGGAINSGEQVWPTGYGSKAMFETLGGRCASFEEALEGYMATAGTHYKKFADIFYDGLVHPTSISAFSSDLNNFNATATYPPAGSGLVCRCTAYNSDPCQGEFSKRFVQAMDDNNVDVLIYPVHGNNPPVIGDWTPDFVRNTYISPSTGTPAITVPMGFSAAGLPAGLMISGRHFDEPSLFMAAYGYEQATLHRKPSPLFPECTNGAPYVPYTTVLAASSDAAQAPSIVNPYPSMRKLLAEQST